MSWNIYHCHVILQKLTLNNGEKSGLAQHIILIRFEILNVGLNALYFLHFCWLLFILYYWSQDNVCSKVIIFSFVQCAVRAAIHGRVLVLEGIEKAERNVLPVLNNLLENREMQLDDGRFLMASDRYDKLLQVSILTVNFTFTFYRYVIA